MLIFGWNSKNLKQAPLEAYECPNCKTKNSVIAIIADYFHLFWIPTFPYKKTAHIVLKDLEEKTIYNHYLLKVVDIVDDSLHVTFNSYSYDRIVSKLDPEDGFYDVWYSMHTKDLQDFDKSGKLRKVIREYKPYTGFEREIEYKFQEGQTSPSSEGAPQN